MTTPIAPNALPTTEAPDGLVATLNNRYVRLPEEFTPWATAEAAADRAEAAAAERFTSIADAQAFIAGGGDFVNGQTYPIAGTLYVGRTGANAITGLPNLAKQTDLTYTVADGPSGVVKGPYLAITNNRNDPGYLGPLLTVVNEGRPTGGNQIGRTLLYFNNEESVDSWGDWVVVNSPLPFGSGLFNAPTVLPTGRIVTSEINPQARSMDPGAFKVEARLYGGNPVGGEQTIPETNDFSATLGNTRVGYNITHGYLLGRSPYTANYAGGTEHAKILCGWQTVPNTIAADGYGTAIYGHRTYVKTITIASGGTGYVAGNLITFASGLGSLFNLEATVKVLTVDGSGVILTAELFEAGGYTASFAATVGVTGGAGTGATFTYTLSSAADYPTAAHGVMGNWEYGLDFCAGGDSRFYSTFVNSGIRFPNNALAVSGRNAANSADVEMLRLNTSNRGVLMGQEIIPWTAYTPTITSEGGTIDSTSIQNARYRKIGNTVSVQVSFGITTATAPTGRIYVTLPVNVLNRSTGVGRDVSGGAIISAYANSASPTRMELLAFNGATPIVVGNFYSVTLDYEVA